MIGETFVKNLVDKLTDEVNIARFVKYYWIISTLRLIIGFTILMFIILKGYKFANLVIR